MILLKACADCGELTDRARCQTCRPPEDKPSATSRGYDSTWAKLSTRARRLQPFCTDCGTREDLTADHSQEAWTRRQHGKPIRLRDVAVVCRSLQRPPRTSTTQGQCSRSEASGPPGKAKFGITRR